MKFTQEAKANIVVKSLADKLGPPCSSSAVNRVWAIAAHPKISPPAKKFWKQAIPISRIL